MYLRCKKGDVVIAIDDYYNLVPKGSKGVVLRKLKTDPERREVAVKFTINHPNNITNRSTYIHYGALVDLFFKLEKQ